MGKRELLGEMNEFVSTMTESSVLFPFVSGSSLEIMGHLLSSLVWVTAI